MTAHVHSATAETPAEREARLQAIAPFIARSLLCSEEVGIEKARQLSMGGMRCLQVLRHYSEECGFEPVRIGELVAYTLRIDRDHAVLADFGRLLEDLVQRARTSASELHVDLTRLSLVADFDDDLPPEATP